MANEIASTGTLETVTAERAAVESGDTGAFLEASRARRAGKEPASVERPKATEAAEVTARGGAQGRAAVVPGKDGAAAKGPKPGDREADERLTTRVREAVDTSTAELRKQNRELAEELAAIRVRTTSTAEKAGAGAGEKVVERKALTSAEIREYQTRPGAPKLDDKDGAGAFLYETSGDHAIAMADFIRETRAEERRETSQRSGEQVERVKRDAARVTVFKERVNAFKTAHPDKLIDNGNGGKAIQLSPEVGGLHGFATLLEINKERQGKGLAPLPATVDHAIAEEMYDSEIPMEVGVYLSEHPEELEKLRTAQTTAQLTRAFGALEERVRKASPTKSTTEAAATVAASKRTDTTEARREAEQAVDRSVSSARPLVGDNLGRAGAAGADPVKTAIALDDFGMFQESERQRRIELLASRGVRR